MRQARWLIDTNVLLRLMNKHSAEHGVCAAAMDRLFRADVLFLFCLQNAAEFWNVSTRPVDRNGFALTPDETALNLKHIAETMTFLADDGKVFAEWRRLVAIHQVSGVQVHDARLVASMIVHEVPQILTLNGADFSRFPEVQAVHPGRFYNRRIDANRNRHLAQDPCYGRPPQSPKAGRNRCRSRRV